MVSCYGVLAIDDVPRIITRRAFPQIYQEFGIRNMLFVLLEQESGLERKERTTWCKHIQSSFHLENNSSKVDP